MAYERGGRTRRSIIVFMDMICGHGKEQIRGVQVLSLFHWGIHTHAENGDVDDGLINSN